jgi:hypothetical protein
MLALHLERFYPRDGIGFAFSGAVGQVELFFGI